MKIIKNWIKNWATKKNIRRWNRVKKTYVKRILFTAYAISAPKYFSLDYLQ